MGGSSWISNAQQALGGAESWYGAAMLGRARPLILGSRSPRRAELLTQIGLPFVVVVPEVDESTRAGESPEDYIARVTADKAHALRALVGERPHACRLVADTVVTLEGRILGKPDTTDHAFAMLQSLQGSRHQVLTRFQLELPEGESRARTVGSWVTFRAASEAELWAYARSGEGLDKAGAYAIQGLGACLVERLEGSYSGVVGLPLAELTVELQSLGVVRELPLAPLP